MTYTFWHAGLLIGESDLDHGSEHPRQRGGVFIATPYGLSIFPRLSGLLSAGQAVKTYLDAQGRSPDDLNERELDELLERTPVGQRMMGISRLMTQVEVRAPDGRRLEIASIAFTDVAEVTRVARELAVDGVDDLPELPPDAPQHIVSLTLRYDWATANGTRRSGAGRSPRRIMS